MKWLSECPKCNELTLITRTIYPYGVPTINCYCGNCKYRMDKKMNTRKRESKYYKRYL